MAAMPSSDPLSDLRAAVGGAAGALRDGGAGAEPTLERPPKDDLGDYSSNAAMLLAAPLGEKPRDVAERLRAELERDLEGTVDRIEVAGPGFVNLFLADGWYREAVAGLLAAEDLGRPAAAGGERVLVEFVSANPTGPLTAAGGRHAAYGDTLARLFEAAGNEVSREYYVNDTGGQIDRFAASIAARMTGSPLPEDGYEGAYVEDLAERLREEGVDPGDLDALARRGVELMLEQIRAVLHDYGADFDSWFSERTLHESGAVERTLERLRETGHTYESEGALWLRTTDFGDDKDRVLIRADGEPTYFGGDVAYHADKLERGFRRLIVVLGADHHGYTARMRAAVEALGAPEDAYQATIMQLVNIVEGGERAQMSKRRGEFVSLAELIGDIGVDATRFFMLQRSHDTPVNLDLELARRQSNENPVYYVQYAHARIASILRKAGEDAEERAGRMDPAVAGAALGPSERQLVKRLLELPGEVLEAAERRAPHRLTAYATAVAADFHAFYRDCRVVGAEGEGVEEFRLGLSLAAKRTIARTLELLGVSAPERM
jgi:arginyl-tRNA synthetase